MSLCAGDLREHCVIQSVTRTKDSAGNTYETWTDGPTVACAVSSVSGKDYFAAAAAGVEDTVTFTVRFISGLDLSNRIYYNGQQFVLKEINLLGARRDFIRLKARAVEGAGVRT